jgi:hypothetical protein
VIDPLLSLIHSAEASHETGEREVVNVAGGTQPAVWRGSEKTAAMVKDEIARRWGNEEAEKYDPRKNCFTYRTWQQKGYQVKKGEKAIRSQTLVEVTDPDAKDATKAVAKYPKTVFLFYYKQVEARKAA